MPPVQSHVLLALHGVHEHLHFLLLLILGLEGGEGDIVRLDGGFPRLAVDIGHPAIQLLLELVPQAADGGDAHGPGQDGGMAVARPALGDEAQDLAFIKLKGLGGGQVVGGQDHRLLRVDAAVHDAHEIVQNPPGHVLDVRRPGLHIGVVHGGQHGGELLPGDLHGPFGGAALLLQRRVHAVAEILILHEHGVGLEEHGGLVPRLLPGLVRQGVELLHGLCLGLLQAALLLLQPGGLGVGRHGLGPLIEVDGALYHAFGHPLPLHQDHVMFLLFNMM